MSKRQKNWKTARDLHLLVRRLQEDCGWDFTPGMPHAVVCRDGTDVAEIGEFLYENPPKDKRFLLYYVFAYEMMRPTRSDAGSGPMHVVVGLTDPVIAMLCKLRFGGECGFEP